MSTTLGVTGCPNCLMFQECGGHPLPIWYKLGCANFANSAAVDTDDMNPAFENQFWKLWNDVNGLQTPVIGKLAGIEPKNLPTYIPMLQHKYMGRARSLDVPIIALKLFDVLKKPKGGIYAPRFSTAATLRAGYKLRQDTKILLIGVDVDAPLETFWAEHQVSGVCEALANLDVLGVTVPNYSFFTCVPRFQILRNRKRMLLAAERISQGGNRVSPHLHGNTLKDWDFCLDFLKDHSELSTVTMEFQTGPRVSEEVGREVFNHLLRIRDNLGRPIHPLIVGGARYYQELMKEFGSSFTVIDSQPFMKAVSRQILTPNSKGDYSWQDTPTRKGAPLDDIIETNIVHYPDKLAAGAVEDVQRPMQYSNQGELNWLTSTPYLTAQPVA